MVVALAALIFTNVSFAGQQQQSSPPLVGPAQTPRSTFPKEIRGYKVERAKVEIKKPKDAKGQDQSTGSTATTDADALIQFGEPRIAKMTPLGITMEVPVTVSAVKQGGRVDFLTFE
ncbi:MAG: hypothetical protein H0X14_10985, partial [Acidobacteria bacterium]|nr:hypothetical protein [Acidobacteriota bacterium]